MWAVNAKATLTRGGFFIDPNQKETHEPNHREQRKRPCCQRQFKFDPFGYEFGNLNLTPHLLNITHAW